MKVSPLRDFILRTLATVVITTPLVITFSPSASGDELALDIKKIDVISTQVESTRGAALVVLKDGSLLLGGGERGDTLFLYSKNELTTVGKVLSQRERNRDSRFAPTDIAILSENSESAELLISYPQLTKRLECVRLVLFRYTFSKVNVTIKKGERWFQGKPFVPVSAVQHAAGRLEVINSKSVYLTTGDLGYPKINQVAVRGTLGGVFRVTANSSKQISKGHRNPQGIVKIGSGLYISEHGPSGGDELNLIKSGKDYGWPFVTYGEPYGSGDYVRPTNTGTHAGFEKPLYHWVPSVAPTELVHLPSGPQWKNLQSHIVMGTLAEQALIFIELTAPNKVGAVISHDVGERIRDLELMPDGTMVATTDSGMLLFISKREV